MSSLGVRREHARIAYWAMITPVVERSSTRSARSASPNSFVPEPSTIGWIWTGDAQIDTVYQGTRRWLSPGMTRKAILALALLGATLPAATASAQVPPSLPGVPAPVLPLEPGLTPFPETVGPQIRQFDCRTYWIRSSEPPHKYEQQTVCFGFEITPR